MTVTKLAEIHRRHLDVQARDLDREVSIVGLREPAADSASLAAQLLGRIHQPIASSDQSRRTGANCSRSWMHSIRLTGEVIALRHFEQLDQSGNGHCSWFVKIGSQQPLRPGNAAVTRSDVRCEQPRESINQRQLNAFIKDQWNGLMSKTQSKSEVINELADEFAERYRRGERPKISDYIIRYPAPEAEIREVLSALVHVERLAPSPDTQSTDQSSSISDRSMPAALGDFRIIREAGRGGMGVVYEAEQVSLGRRVALKVLPQQAVSDSKYKKRFLREAKAAARLHHTNIVPVFGVGEQDGVSFYVMQFIHGPGLDDVLLELKRLREESEAGHKEREDQVAQETGIEAASVESNEFVATAVGQEISTVHVAQSLLSGQFEQTWLFNLRFGSTGDRRECNWDGERI